MTGRILICIGCDQYSDGAYGILKGAEADAKNVYGLLQKPGVGEYDPDRSSCLLSPKLEDVRVELQKLALDTDQIETLTVYFAGHGEVHRGSMYLCLADTNASALSVTAFSLSDLLRLVADQQVPRTNIILDTCHSGGLLLDLGTLLKADAIGARDTPGVTILAMAASDEYAGENSKGGFGTQILLECLSGTRVINTDRPALELIEVGREVSLAFGSGAAQKPVFWGLNLTGTSNFCINPNYNSSEQGTFTNFLDPQYSAVGGVDEVIRNELWKMYLDLPSKWVPREFFEALSQYLEAGSDTCEGKIGPLENIAVSFGEAARQNPDKIVAAEVYATTALALLQYSEGNSHVDDASERLCFAAAACALSAMEELVSRLERDANSLLHHNDGAFEFYYLPIRISKILAWSAYAMIAAVDEEASTRAKHAFVTLVEVLRTHYPLCFVAMSDAQSGAVAALGASLASLKLNEELCEILSFYLNSISTVNGMVACSGIHPSKIFDYLAARASGSLEPKPGLVARPTELTAVCFRLAEIAGMQEVVDDLMQDLDHVPLNAFLPSEYTKIGRDLLDRGTNATMFIGLHIFSMHDFTTIFPTELIERPKTMAQRFCNIASSLIFPDRTPWVELFD